MPTVRTNDIETYYERRDSGRPIVFVHGAILDHTQWTAQIDALSDDYTTIAYDVRGNGRTGGSARTAYSIGSFADDLDALVTVLDLDRPVLCGLSMGGCIAQVYAARHPDRLAGLVLADTFTPELLREASGSSGRSCCELPSRRFDSSATSAWRKRWCDSKNGSRDRASAATTGRSSASGPKDRAWRPRNSPR